MNRNFLLAFNIVLLILIGVLFYLHFSSSAKHSASNPVSVHDTAQPGSFRIAYFDMDSIERNYSYLKDVKNELKAKEDQLNGQLTAMKNRYMTKVTKFQQEAQSMTQEKQGAMQQDLMQEQKVIQNKEQAINGELQDESFKKMQNVNRTIEDFLKEYNKNKEYAYILGYQTGTIYYKDTRYDITGPVLQGLNERYKSKNKE
jgi:outer membrane protein